MEELKERWRRNKRRQRRRDAKYREETGLQRPRFTGLDDEDESDDTDESRRERKTRNESELSEPDSETDPLIIEDAERPTEPQPGPSGLQRPLRFVEVAMSSDSTAETILNRSPSPNELRTTKPTITSTVVYKIPRIRLNKCVQDTTDRQAERPTTEQLIAILSDDPTKIPDLTLSSTPTPATEKEPTLTTDATPAPEKEPTPATDAIPASEKEQTPTALEPPPTPLNP